MACNIPRTALIEVEIYRDQYSWCGALGMPASSRTRVVFALVFVNGVQHSALNTRV